MSWSDVPWAEIIKGVGSGINQSNQQSNSNQQADLDRQLRLDAQKQQAEIEAAKLARSAVSDRMHNSVHGDIMANVQKSGTTGSGRDLRFTGGLSPNLLSQDSRDLGRVTSRQALLSAMNGDDKNGQIGGVDDPYAKPKLLTNSSSSTPPSSGSSVAGTLAADTGPSLLEKMLKPWLFGGNNKKHVGDNGGTQQPNMGANPNDPVIPGTTPDTDPHQPIINHNFLPDEEYRRLYGQS
jgi:hypothetical protein